MRIGSITKTFTGTVVLQLVDEGWLGLEDPISRHLTGVPNGDNITIRQLLNMTSGLYNYSEDLAFNQALDTDPERVWTPEDLFAIGLGRPPYFLPGKGFHCSELANLGGALRYTTPLEKSSTDLV
jgi:D-alanyl-D-alanine carboxypeptidase